MSTLILPLASLTFCFMLMIAMYTYFWSSDPLSHPYSHTLTLTPCSHVSFSSSYFSSRHPVITLHHISFLPLSYKYYGFTDVFVCICKITTGKCQMLDLLGWGMTRYMMLKLTCAISYTSIMLRDIIPSLLG